ncbi:MAG: hypothetical protein ACR2O8_09405, partial [Rhizobiaceae bacterium]
MKPYEVTQTTCVSTAVGSCTDPASGLSEKIEFMRPNGLLRKLSLSLRTSTSMRALTFGIGVLALAPQAAQADCLLDGPTQVWTCDGVVDLTTDIDVIEGQNITINAGATLTRNGGNLIQINQDGANGFDGGTHVTIELKENAVLHQTATGDTWAEPIYIKPWVDDVSIILRSGSKIIHDGLGLWNNAINTDTSVGNIKVLIEQGALIQTNGGGVFSVDNSNNTHPYGGLQGFVEVYN